MAEPNPAQETARCHRCGERKPTTDFYADASKASGRKSICKPCDRAKSRDYYAANTSAVGARVRAQRGRSGPRQCASCDAPAASPRHRYCADCSLAAEVTRRQRWYRGRATPERVKRDRARERERQRSRPNAAKRGYGQRHQQLRKRLAPQVAAGVVDCARCGQRIEPGEPWDLGHHDQDRSRYIGPEHRGCNRATKGRRPTTSRRW